MVRLRATRASVRFMVDAHGCQSGADFQCVLCDLQSIRCTRQAHMKNGAPAGARALHPADYTRYCRIVRTVIDSPLDFDGPIVGNGFAFVSRAADD